MSDKELQYLFHEGTLYKAYDYLGCNLRDGKADFRTFAPRADKVAVMGDFSLWQELELTRITDGGLWELTNVSATKGQEYKFVIYSGGKKLIKSDPYAKQTNTREFTNSIISDHDFGWTDEKYLRRRARRKLETSPMNIYEAHIGSWKKGLGYREFADEIAPYLTEMGFTHLELMGICEYPLDDSWGYQVTGYFSPTRRYGDNADFAYLVDKLHAAGIGVIIDWVPGHFPRNEEGLFRYDGSELYEKSGFMGEHKEWGTCCFDYGRNEVRSFLISSAIMWLTEYHVDGIRVDAVASMLYLDYGRTEWLPNRYGGKENLEAIDFLRRLNKAVHTLVKGAFTVAEESTSFGGVTDREGLGFDLKWNMGWMHDTLKYLATDPLFRRYEHDKMTFSMTYAFSEKFVLPISHDEVVYGKGSLISKAAGDYDGKFGSLKAYLAMMYAHPGKKLLFMGSEIAQFDEWDFRGETQWNLLGYESHRAYRDYVKKLCRIYIKYKPFFADDSWNGFKWKVVDDRYHNIFAVERIHGVEKILVAVNFSPVSYSRYFIPSERKFRPLLTEGDCDYKAVEGGMELKLGGYAVIILRSSKEKKV